MKSRVQKWGNSLALRIPKAFASEVDLKQDSWVDLSLTSGKLVVTVINQPQFTLKSLLSEITEKNIHSESDTGPAVGGEVW